MDERPCTSVLTPSTLLPPILPLRLSEWAKQEQRRCAQCWEKEKRSKRSEEMQKGWENIRGTKEICSGRWDILRRPKQLGSLSGTTVWSPFLYISQPKCYSFNLGYQMSCICLHLCIRARFPGLAASQIWLESDLSDLECEPDLLSK